jgi:D-alanyl-D-alanine carboxypeptidase (penicillin-binding protein 5/6)
MKPFLILLCGCLLATQAALAGRAQIDMLAREPYRSALVLDAHTGEILFEDHANAAVYPASVLKLMNLLILLERIQQGTTKLDEMVQVTQEAAAIGGSQVYLDPREQFSVEDLLYALAVQSANDAAVALALHISGSKEGFIALMNQRAVQLGMKDTQFHSVHGLPPSEGGKPDVTTASDLAILGRALVKIPDVFKYTSIKERAFRDGKFILRNHNHLLGAVTGCDGFKTGYFKAAGFSIVATAQREGVRIIAIVMGSKDRKVRDAKASELLAKGFAQVPPRAVAQPVVSPQSTPAPPADETPAAATGSRTLAFFAGVVTGMIISALLALYLARKRNRPRGQYLH